MTKNDLDGWVFTFNPHTGNWRACTRDRYNNFFSIPEEYYPRTKDIGTLVEFIMKHEGNESLITQLVNKS